MESIIQFVQTEQNPIAKRLIEEKLADLSKKYDWLIRADVFFKSENDQEGKGKVCEIRISCPGPRIFAESTKESHEAAVAETIRDIEKQVRRRKEEMRMH